MCQIIIHNKEKEKDFELFLNDFSQSFKMKIKEYSEDENYNRFNQIKHYILFFMIMFLNLKNEISLIKIILNEKLNYLINLFESINCLKSKKKYQLFSFLSNIFIEEYKDIFFHSKDKELENLFIEMQSKISDFGFSDNNIYEEKIYKKMLENLFKFDINYNNFFNNNKIDAEQRPVYKSIISQSLIRVIFSKIKNKFYPEENAIYYEYDFIKGIIDKDIIETREKFGDDYQTLFKKEDICDDFIKHLFFVFGSTVYIDSFVIPIKNSLSKIGITDSLIQSQNNNLSMKRNITKDEFNNLFDKILDTLSSGFPNILKTVLKLIYESTLEHFTIDKNNYSPLYKCLIFNFLISPRIQMIYSINPIHCVFVKSFNRLLKNICFNSKFHEGDPLSSFNDIIEINYKKLQKFINDNIISFEINNDIKKSIKEFSNEKYLSFPKFLFFSDSQYIIFLFERFVEKNVNFGAYS